MKPTRRTAPRRSLLAADLRGSSPDEISAALRAVLDQSGVAHDDRVQVLASTLVVEALRPYWTDGRTPQEAHAACAEADPELARMIEAIAPPLLERVEVREEARAAISDIERLLGF